jgi:hypothetical protein
VDEAGDGAHGEIPDGVGPELFRERLRQVAGLDPEDGAHVTLGEQSFYLADIESVEADQGGGDDEARSRITLRNGAIIAGVTGAAIVAALATIRFRKRRSN